jgi:hypothetical protein
MTDKAEEQRRLILDQFTRQAVPFAEMPAHSNEQANRLLIDLVRIDKEDNVLDAACVGVKSSPGPRPSAHSAHCRC